MVVSWISFLYFSSFGHSCLVFLGCCSSIMIKYILPSLCLPFFKKRTFILKIEQNYCTAWQVFRITHFRDGVSHG